jgi:thiamine biosynthesis lipoprotein
MPDLAAGNGGVSGIGEEMMKDSFYNKKRQWVRLLHPWRAAVLMTLTAPFLAGCSPKEHSISFTAMDTYMELTAYGNAETALEQAKERLLELQRLLSVTDSESEIYAVNHAEGQRVSVSEDTFELLKFTLDMARRTDGALDPTVYPVVQAWGFTTDCYRVPEPEALEALLQLVDYSAVQLSDGTVQLPAGMELDLGAVAKGYGADAVSEILKTAGIKSALISLGGNIQAVGEKPDGGAWRIGIQEPDGEGYLGIVSVKDGAVVTSGAYERYFTGTDGQVYGHILDPATGRPADSGLESVTIITDSGAYADALSTAVFVMGAEKAEALWSTCGDFDMVLVTTDGEILATNGLLENFTIVNQEYELHWIY